MSKSNLVTKVALVSGDLDTPSLRSGYSATELSIIFTEDIHLINKQIKRIG